MNEESKKYDLVGKIMDYECGLMETRESVEFIAELVETGLINQLQGNYQRTAQNLISHGLIDINGKVNYDELDFAIESEE